MADPRMPEDWQTPNYRQQIVQKFEDAMRNSQSQMPKSSVEMEEYVFRKARSREEYLDFVARVLLSVAENNKEKKGVPPGMVPQVPMGAGGQPGMVGGPVNMGGPSSGMGGAGMGGPTSGMSGPVGTMVGGPPSQGGPDPINALQNLAGQGTGSMVRQQPGMMGNMHAMGVPPTMMDQTHMIRGQRMRGHISQKPSQLTRHDAFMVTSPQTMTGQGQALPASSMVYQGQGVPVRSMVPMGLPGQYMMQPQNRDVGMANMAIQSPAQGSPVTMMPSPHQPGMMPSPMMRPPMGVPSPSTVLHTPGNAYTDPSPGPPSQSQEEMEYVKKIEKLSKYIEPLRKSLQESEKKTDEESQRNHKKMKNLLEVLTNPKKRAPLEFLERCEQVLLKVPSSASSSNSNGHMCQPLLDAVAHFSSATSLNHSLYRTFGPALEAYMGPPIKAPSPPPIKKRHLEKETGEELPDVLQGEIARLGRRFVISVDSRRHPGSETHHIVCKLEDPRLPSVPPLLVTVPKSYPKCSPQCEPTNCPGYDATEFFQNVENNLTVHISNMPNRFCLTQLLNSWEMSVRKACDSKNPLISQANPIFI